MKPAPPAGPRPPGSREETCGDAVEVSSSQLADTAALELEGGGAVNGGNGGVGLLQPVHQPPDATVAAEGVPPQVPEETAETGETRGPPPGPPPGPAPWTRPLGATHTHRSVRTSRGPKRPLGSCCRLLLERDLEKERLHPLTGRGGARPRGHQVTGSPGQGVTGTYRCVRDLSPRKVNLDRVWMSLFSMNLRRKRTS